MSVHRQTFVKLVQGQGWTRGAELGVDKGILFGMLLRSCPALHLTGVDTFPDPLRSHRVPALAQEFADRARVLMMTTREALALVQDGSLDFVFIDADHSAAAVAGDITYWRPKVRPGGWLGGHDYHARKFPGVVTAVNERFAKRHHTMPGTIWGVWC